MKRRSFLRGIITACVAPQLLVDCGFKWKRTEAMWIPNPDWVKAPYELVFDPITYAGSWKFIVGDSVDILRLSE